MNVYSLIPLTAFLFNGFVWTYIFAQKRQNSISRAFLYYAADLSLWLITVIIIRLPVDRSVIFPAIKIGSIAWLSITFFFLNFTYEFLGKKRDSFFYTFLLLSLFGIIISLNTKLVTNGFDPTFWGPNETHGSLFIPFVIFIIILPGVYSLHLIRKAIKQKNDKDQRSTLSLIFFGSLFALLIGIVSNVILPSLLNIRTIVKFGESGTVIQSILIFWAVIKYKLFKPGVDEVAYELFANMKEAVVILDKTNKISLINDAAINIFGEEIKNKKFSEVFTEFDPLKNYHDYEQKFVINGKEMILSLSKTDIGETAIEFGKIIIIRDITENRHNQALIKKSKALLAQAEELAHLGSWEWDTKNNKVTWSDELYKIYGLESNEFEGSFEGYLKRVHPGSREYVKQKLTEALQRKKHFDFYERIVRPNGSIRILYSNGIVITDEDGNPAQMIGGCLDVTDFKNTEYELRNSQQQLRALAASLQSAREEERIHLAKEIHDELGQVLSAIKMDLTLLTESGQENGKAAINENLHSIIKLIDNLILKIRNIASDLRPDVLDSMDLVEAIEWQITEFQKSNGKIEYIFNSDIEGLILDKERTTAVFRIFQEALTNIVRHSDCSKTEICLNGEDGKLY